MGFFASVEEIEVRPGSFLSMRTFLLGDSVTLEEAEIVADMKFLVPLEVPGDRTFPGFKIWSFSFSLLSRSGKNPDFSLPPAEFLRGKSAKHQKIKLYITIEFLMENQSTNFNQTGIDTQIALF